MMALVSLIVTFVLPKSQIFTAIDIAATKIYTNMLLAIINARSNNDADTQATNHSVENFTDDTGGSLGWLCKRTTVIASYAATSSGSPSYLPERRPSHPTPFVIDISITTEVDMKYCDEDSGAACIEDMDPVAKEDEKIGASGL
ncbi:hypothetical protein BD309DRAFT_306876 [Dichomitus squalens]|nr:hypothetical protein BD309DRAFT_306876 [Dichomitus squalens]